MMYRFGPSGGIDPSSQTEDLGDDAIKASEYGIKNLKRIRARLDEDQKILIGGSGAPESLPGVIWMNDLNSLFESLNSNVF